jgi:hypothetical protein
VSEALTFAYHFEQGSVKGTLAGLGGGRGIGNGLGLAGLDGAAQAGSIQRAVVELERFAGYTQGAIERNVIMLKYGRLEEMSRLYIQHPCVRWVNAVFALRDLLGLTEGKPLAYAIIERAAPVANRGYFAHGFGIGADNKPKAPSAAQHKQIQRLRDVMRSAVDSAEESLHERFVAGEIVGGV